MLHKTSGAAGLQQHRASRKSLAVEHVNQNMFSPFGFIILVQQLRKQEKAKQIELSGNVKQLEEKNTKLVSEVADLHDHLDALGLGAVVR